MGGGGGGFKWGGTSLEDERHGCPLDAMDEEMCNKVQDLVIGISGGRDSKHYGI